MTCITIFSFAFVSSTHAVGMAVLRPYGSKIDFVRNPYFWISFMIFRYYP